MNALPFFRFHVPSRERNASHGELVMLDSRPRRKNPDSGFLGDWVELGSARPGILLEQPWGQWSSRAKKKGPIGPGVSEARDTRFAVELDIFCTMRGKFFRSCFRLVLSVQSWSRRVFHPRKFDCQEFLVDLRQKERSLTKR